MSHYDAPVSSVNDSAGTRRKPKWTIMVYLAGDNNLTSNSIAIMQELERANHREDVRVLACFDSNTPRPKGARYMEINYRRFHGHPPFDWGLHNDLVPPEEMDVFPVVNANFCDECPTSSPTTTEPDAQLGLERFLTWALKHHRGDHHMLILFGHGTAVAGNTFLADNNPPSFLRLKEFAKVLKHHFPGGHRKLDILACDNCIMNGIETAYQIRDNVDVMIGSQDLMLTVGWPYRKIIDVIERRPEASSIEIAHQILKACARRLLDFTLMDRSSEQSICDLTKLRRGTNIVSAVRELSRELQKGLAYDPCTGEILYPPIRDAVVLARLEAQSFWSETFVDLYDFCELLLKRCNVVMENEVKFVIQYFDAYQDKSVNEQATPERGERSGGLRISGEVLVELRRQLLNSPITQHFRDIGYACLRVLNHFKERRKAVVPFAYYVCPALQYSHGLSIYFPWTLPNDPIIFEPVPDSYGHWPRRGEPTNYSLKTAFDEYKEYDFAKCEGGEWANFLVSYFRATLRNVRRADERFMPVTDARDLRFFEEKVIRENPAPPVNLQKSSSSTGDEGDCVCPTIKNYPRRYYLSPVDCHSQEKGTTGPSDTSDHVSYLGWHLRGIVAEVIGLPATPLIEAEAENEDNNP